MFSLICLETLKTFLTMMIMEFRIMIHPEQQGRICCLCQQGGKNLDVVLGEAVAVDGASVHSSDVVYAAFELRLRSLVPRPPLKYVFQFVWEVIFGRFGTGCFQQWG
ncbi:uncharacterized protein LOC126630618 isoform X2 [Malus sylvestris]|uniref:uncharacterized protein LOC126630618 isoform X2 n=1 Tax=Malus sylvestris TaxID=3752 RepID=UPI0021ACCB3D|nr:uncharacterized protein LOC126630618 isoform X2 [Malus sylvestris]